MKKAKAEIEETVVFRPGGTDRAIRELAQATHRLTMRRIRDSLPGKIATKRLVLRAPIRGDVPDLVADTVTRDPWRVSQEPRYAAPGCCHVHGACCLPDRGRQERE